jgi:hypothetical protein
MFYINNRVPAVLHLAVTPQLASDSRRSTLVISDHWPIDQAGGNTILIAERNGDNHPASKITLEFFIWGVTYHLKNESLYTCTTPLERNYLRLFFIIRRVTVN